MDGALARGTAIVAGPPRQGAAVRRRQPAGRLRRRRSARGRCRARRALRPGAAGRRAQRSAPKCRPPHGHDGFNVRVGIHTGGVLLGGGVDAEGSIRGIAVNIAARMEQTAPAGALRISHDTYRQVRGAVRRRAAGAAGGQGRRRARRRPTSCCAPSRAPFASRSRGIEGVATRMIGRDAELAALQDAFERLFAERRLGAGHRGRRGRHRQEPAALRVRGLEPRPGPRRSTSSAAAPPRRPRASPIGLLRDILAWRLQIADDDSVEAAKRKIEAGIVPLFEADDGADLAEAHAHLLGHLIGLDFSDSRHVSGILDDAQADPQPRLPRGGADVPPRRGAARRRRHPGRAAARRPALGRRRHAGLPGPPGRGQPRRADADARPDAACAVRAPRRLGRRIAPPAHRPEPARRERRAGCWPASC